MIIPLEFISSNTVVVTTVVLKRQQ